MAHELPQAEVGIFGGSGFYELFEGECEEVLLDTVYGRPSDVYTIGTIGGRRVAFLPRHGRNHSIGPAEVNYRANVYGMKLLGVDKIIGPCSVGSLRLDIHPGDFVICDQFVDRTKDRPDTYFTHDRTLAVQHLSSAEPYCAEMGRIAAQCCRDLGITVHEGGTVVTIQGPRFSTKAESEWFHAMGWDVVNMTQYPECWLARELGIHYCNVSLVTDYDAGCGEHAPVTWEMVQETFAANIEHVRALVGAMVPALPSAIDDGCTGAAGLVE
ncbi:MTAP family purine nucleoside phosphorylase [Olsenella sp. YH-ols2217]|uniref:Purine nucleoside phosphorylase n=1 Tax=Kribbibacterium absianum TaxID=3044210 RepID=A0ABT6ZKN4_9ACTN|nr:MULTISPECIES: MTAP family purine nucleoside phosphorylase [unclassified Olsenella]MDJ1121609.1 MTAP family purine nucleoside phosphorylase [Olsenella sp. YH-ols2216]MDJ1129617.1 MTAP family purine nucleoside phosphorylase [Olsenella sp. YH-ols2217]